MTKDVRTKVIDIPFNAKDSSIILEQKLNGFFEEEGKGLSLKDVQITHAVEYSRPDFPIQIYTIFYEKKKFH